MAELERLGGNLAVLPPCLAAWCPVRRPGGGALGDKHRADPVPNCDFKTYQLRMHFHSPQFAVQTPSVCLAVRFLSIGKCNRMVRGHLLLRRECLVCRPLRAGSTQPDAGLVGGKPDAAWRRPVTASQQLSPGSIRAFNDADVWQSTFSK